MGGLTLDQSVSRIVFRQLRNSALALTVIVVIAFAAGVLISRSVGLIIVALGVFVVLPLSYHHLFVAEGAPLNDLPISAVPPIPVLFGRAEQE